MRVLDGKRYLEPDDVLKMIGDEFTAKDMISFLESGDLEGIRDGSSWLVEEGDLAPFIRKFKDSNAFYLGYRNIDLKDFRLRGRVLDIGGGGEGVIGQLAGESAIAIDKLKSELEEASECKCIKIVMDATEMGFIDGTFDTVTAFFSFMYMPPDDIIKVLREAYRVLKDRGELHIWDMSIPKRFREDKEYYVILLLIDIGKDIIRTGYGTRWNRTQDSQMLLSMAAEEGFKIMESLEDGDVFHIRLEKTANKDKNVKSKMSD